MKRVTAVEPATLEAAAVEARVSVESTLTMPAAPAMPSFISMPSTGTIVAPSAIVTATVEASTSIEAMEPRTSTNKNASDEIIRAVVAVRCTGVGGIPIVAIGADRRRLDIGRPSVDWSDANPYSKPNLRVGSPRPCQSHQESE
jgi:hypothetical protein